MLLVACFFDNKVSDFFELFSERQKNSGCKHIEDSVANGNPKRIDWHVNEREIKYCVSKIKNRKRNYML